MNYENLFNKHYDLNYSLQETNAKSHFINVNSRGRDFEFVFNTLKENIVRQNQSDNFISHNKDLIELLYIFNNRNKYYSKDIIQNIFKNEIFTVFEKIENLPSKYNFKKFIQDLAIYCSNVEILSLLTINFVIYRMMFELDSFEKFEIKMFSSSIESTSIFKELHQELYPEEYTIIENIKSTNQSSGGDNMDNLNSINPKKSPKKNHLNDIHGIEFREFFTEEFRKKHFTKIEDLQVFMQSISIKDTAILVFLLKNEYNAIFEKFNLSGFIRSSKSNMHPQSIEKHFVAHGGKNNYKLKESFNDKMINKIKVQLYKIIK